MYGGVGEVRKGDRECVGEVLDGEQLTEGGESVYCVIEKGCDCCNPLVRGVILDVKLWIGSEWIDSDLKDEEEETVLGEEDAE